MKAGLRAAILLAFLVLAVALAGCGGDDESEQADSSAPTTETAGGQTATKGGEKKSSGGKPAGPPAKAGKRESKAAKARRLARDRKDQKREVEQLEKEEQEFDKEFKESAFEKLLGRLPIRKPPLQVAQYITVESGHKVFAAVDRKRFICKMTVRQREKAVADFFRAANKIFVDGGVNDFSLVVTPLAETTEELPALATARKGSTSLTRRGRASGPC